ncbi:hypothetical protein ACI784_24760 [Geodermatophilus sp. SYSU D01186]
MLLRLRLRGGVEPDGAGGATPLRQARPHRRGLRLVADDPTG